MNAQPEFDFAVGKAPHSTGTVEQSIIADNLTRYAPDFAEWLTDNWHIWREFRRQADKLHAMGRTHYSARTILHWIRHHTALHEHSNGAAWKVNNNVSPDLARLYVDLNGDRESLFEFRVMRNSSKRAQ